MSLCSGTTVSSTLNKLFAENERILKILLDQDRAEGIGPRAQPRAFGVGGIGRFFWGMIAEHRDLADSQVSIHYNFGLGFPKHSVHVSMYRTDERVNNNPNWGMFWNPNTELSISENYSALSHSIFCTRKTNPDARNKTSPAHQFVHLNPFWGLMMDPTKSPTLSDQKL